MRKAYILQRRGEEKGVVQKERVAKAFNKWLEGKSLTNVTPEEVVDFLIFKEMEGKGRTVVHRETCPRLGTTDLKGCKIQECGTRHAYDSLRSGYFEKIKSLFEEGGMGGRWNPQRHEGNPAKSLEVENYLSFVKKEQGLAGITPKQAKVILRGKVRQLIQMLKLLRDSQINAMNKMLTSRDIAIFSLAFCTSKRGDDLVKIVANNVMRIPNKGGLVFNFTWGKTLRNGKGHMFGLECTCQFLEEKGFCASCEVDNYVKEAEDLGWDFNKGYLFSENNHGTKNAGPMKAAKLTRILVGYLKKFDIFDKETMQSFRSGGAICAILEGESLEEVMYRAYWKSPKTAVYYTKVLEVMCPRGFSWEKMGVDVKNTDYNKLDAMPALFKEDFWRAFKTQQSEKIAGRRVQTSSFKN